MSNEKIDKIAEDVAYIRGRIDGLPCSDREKRLQSLEKNQRAQGFLGAVIAGVIGFFQFKGGS